jgi:hypothetical protein
MTSHMTLKYRLGYVSFIFLELLFKTKIELIDHNSNFHLIPRSAPHGMGKHAAMNKWVYTKRIRFFDKRDVLHRMLTLMARIFIPQFTRIDSYDGELVTETEYEKKVRGIKKNTNGKVSGTEYGVENKTLLDVDDKHLLIFPTNCKTGKIEERYKNTPSLYANEPSTVFTTIGGQPVRNVANSMMVANFDTRRMDLLAITDIIAGSEVLLHYGKLYKRKGYRTNCRAPNFWLYTYKGNLVKMPNNICKSMKPVVLEEGKEYNLTFTWKKNNWVEAVTRKTKALRT